MVGLSEAPACLTARPTTEGLPILPLVTSAPLVLALLSLLNDDWPGLCEVVLDDLSLPWGIPAWSLEVLLPCPIQQADNRVCAILPTFTCHFFSGIGAWCGFYHHIFHGPGDKHVNIGVIVAVIVLDYPHSMCHSGPFIANGLGLL